MNKKEQLTIAIIQFEPKWKDHEFNLKKISALLLELEIPVDIIMLPESFSTGFSMKSKKISVPMNHSSIKWMQEISEQYNAAVCGSLFVSENNKFYNRFIWASPNNSIKYYDKRHLFSIADEDKTYTKGNKQLTIEYMGWRIFPQICYDLRFPVWSRNTSDYDLLINVANWPATRERAWRTLLKARAIENQCYAIGVNRLGTDGNDIIYDGNSMIVDYKGKVIMNAENIENVFTFQIDQTELLNYRKKFNTLDDADQFKITFD